MKTLVLDPEQVRAALDVTEFPRRCVWVVSMRGEIVVHDLDEGWMQFAPAKGVTDRQWAQAIKHAVKNLQDKLEQTLATYYRFLEQTDPAIPSQILRLSPPVARRLETNFPPTLREGVTIPIDALSLQKRLERYADRETAPGLGICPVCHIAVVHEDHKPYCSQKCELEEAGDGTRVNIPIPAEFLVKKKTE
jgi:hypothetical protein